MPTVRSNLSLLAGCLFAFTFLAVAAQAQTAQRTFVSTTGNDANTASLCSAANPCRGFAAAQTVTTAGGEIIALTSGGYGPVEITKALQIAAPTGVYVAITAQTGTAIGGEDAIRISAGSTDIVVLRGLTLNSLGVDNGINWDTGAALHVESCVINGFTSRGILFDAAGKLFVKDTIIRNNVFSGNIGILILTTSGTIQASLDRVRLENNSTDGVVIGNAQVSVSNSLAAGGQNGFVVQSGGKLTVSQSVAANNSAAGFVATNGGEMVVENCIARGNNRGMFAIAAGTVMRVSNSVATANATGFLQQTSALFQSRGNNTVLGNTTETSGTITVVSGT